jgi:hypothetical protein
MLLLMGNLNLVLCFLGGLDLIFVAPLDAKERKC